MNVDITDVTEFQLRLRKVGISDWFYTSGSDFDSDNFESEVISKIERLDNGQPECASTGFDLSAGESPHARVSRSFS